MPRIVREEVRMIVPRSPRRARRRVLPLIALLGIGLALGACTKCDVPAWPHSGSAAFPLFCHDTPKPQ